MDSAHLEFHKEVDEILKDKQRRNVWEKAWENVKNINELENKTESYCLGKLVIKEENIYFCRDCKYVGPLVHFHKMES
jgi:hypothetical protein